jgi:hypothetical protein
MRCQRLRLMLVFVILSLSSGCATSVPVDSFCSLYSPIVVAKGDGAITAPLAVKKRILTNEQLYRQQCKPNDR